MIIKELYLEHFGQFHEKKIKLHKGLNIIYGENEAGKTTIHTFIRGMLFGLERGRGKAAKQDTYSKYEPWDMPGAYSGSMRFEIAGVNYRMDREFKTERKSVRVICEDNGKLLTPEEQKELFGGLFEESYYNTVSVSQLGGQTDGDLSLVLKQYAANLSSTKHADMNLKKASEFLRNKKKQMVKENQVDKKAVWKNAWLDLEEKEVSQKVELKALEEQMTKLVAEQQTVQTEYDRELATEQKERDTLRQMQVECKTLCDRQLELIKEQKDLQTKIGEKREQIGRMMQALETVGLSTLDDVLAEMNRQEKKNCISLWSYLFFLLSTICTAYVFLVVQIPTAGFACLAITLTFLAVFIFRTLRRIEAKKEKLMELEKCKDICIRCAATQSEFEQLRKTCEEEEHKSAALNQRIQTMEREIQKKISKMPEKTKEIAKYQVELKQREQKLQWEMEQQFKKQEELAEERAGIRERLQIIGEAEVEVKAVELALSRLEEVAVKIKGSFGIRLNEKASYYIDRITGGKYRKLVMDDDLQIAVHTDHRVLEVSQLSKGTMEQIYLSLRLAAADLIFEQEHKPMLLDDAFVAYDNKRMAMTLQSLSDMVEQSVIFTCHTREKAVLDKSEIPYHVIKL